MSVLSNTVGGKTPSAIVVMGVAGAGKTTVGRALASELRWQFLDADDYHSGENRAKLTAGMALTDGDRVPWLRRLNHVLRDFASQHIPVVLACSALTNYHRSLLLEDLAGVALVYLRANPEIVAPRLAARAHFLNPALLASQFETLEEPEHALVVDAGASVQQITKYIRKMHQLEIQSPITMIGQSD
jgi:gluconokinase